MTNGFLANWRARRQYGRFSLPRRARKSLREVRGFLASGLVFIGFGIGCLIVGFENCGVVAFMSICFGLAMLGSSALHYADYRYYARRAGKRVITLRGRRGSKLRSSL